MRVEVMEFSDKSFGFFLVRNSSDGSWALFLTFVGVEW